MWALIHNAEYNTAAMRIVRAQVDSVKLSSTLTFFRNMTLWQRHEHWRLIEKGSLGQHYRKRISLTLGV